MNYKCNLCYKLCDAGILRNLPCDPILLIEDKKDNEEHTKEGPTMDQEPKTNQESTNVK